MAEIYMTKDVYRALKALEDVIDDLYGIYILDDVITLIEQLEEGDENLVELGYAQDKVLVEDYDSLTEEEQEECKEIYLEQLGARTEFWRKKRGVSVEQMAKMMNMTSDEYLHWRRQDGTLMTLDDIWSVGFALLILPAHLTGYINEWMEPLQPNEDIYEQAVLIAKKEKSRKSGKKEE